jgi:sortase A
MATRRREITRSPVTTHYRRLERLLWFTAVGLLAFSAFMIFGGKIYQFYLKSQFQDSLNEQQLRAAQHTPEFLKFAAAIARAAPEPYLGRVDIPRLDLSVMLLDGVDDTALRFGLGHIPGTALPGQSGNIGIAGHRDTFFRSLAGIRMNDEITVKTLDGDYRYSVDTIRIVDPEDIEVLENSDYPMLTLVTCYPFNLVGPAPKRFVVQASLQ